MTDRRFYGWTLLGALWAVLFLNLGFPAYGPAVINAAMARAIGMPREALGNLFAVYMLLSGLPGPLVAMGVNRFGVRRTLIAGSAMIVAGALLMATVVTGALGGILAFGVLVGAGVATGSALAAQAGIARWFVRKRALALALLYSAGAIGGSVAAPVLTWLMQRTGSWRSGWYLLAGLSVAAALVALIYVRESPEELGQVPDGDRAAGDAAGGKPRPAFITRHDWTLREAMHSPHYWLILLSLVGGSGGYTLFLAHGVVHLIDLGHTAQVGAWAVSVLTVSGLIAKAIVATLGDRIDPRAIWAAFLAAFGIGLILVVDARSLAQVFLFAMCLGIGFGGGIVCLMAVLSNYYGTRVFASLAGTAVAINTTLSALAPKIAGRLYDRGVGYDGTFYFLAGWCMVGALVLFFLRPPCPPAGAVLPSGASS